MRVAIIGAGSTGRGHLAEQLHACGVTDFVFIDNNRKLVDRLAETGAYTVRLLGTDERTIHIDGFRIINRSNEEDAIDALIHTPLVLTAVLAENLPDVSALLSRAVIRRMAVGIDEPWDIICCENYDCASSYLKAMVEEKLSTEGRAYLARVAGFPDCMISRVVPVAHGDPESLLAENYNEWVVRASDVKGSWSYACIDKVDNLAARLERKLWIHNGGHAAIGYIGYLRGHSYIHQAVADPVCAALCVDVMREAGEAILHKYPAFDRAEIAYYIDNFAGRGAIEEMKDDIRRVVRDPLRKIAIHDRLTAPALYAVNHGLSYLRLACAIANITKYCADDDAQSLAMEKSIGDKGLEIFLRNDIGIEQDALIDAVLRCAAEGT